LGSSNAIKVTEGQFSSIKQSTSVNERQTDTELTAMGITRGESGNPTG